MLTTPDSKTIVGALLQDAAQDAGIPVRQVTFKQFKQFAIPVVEADAKLDGAFDFIKDLRAQQFNRFRDAVATWEVEPEDVHQEDLGIVGRQNRKAHREEGRLLAARQDFVSTMGDLLREVEFKLPDYRPPTSKKPMSRWVNLLLSDLHYGANLVPEQNLTSYNWTEEARRTASVFKQTVDYKRDHRAESKLRIILNGDIVQGMLGHDPRDGHPITKQVMGAFCVLSQGILLAAKEYIEVVVEMQPGNHGRIKERHQGRATIDKWDAFETMLYGMLQAAFLNCPNVRFIQAETPFGTYESFGRWAFYTHGDTVMNIGNPGKSVNVAAVETFVDRTNSGRAAQKLPVFELFMIGHTHINLSMTLDNGCEFINNGCLIPPDGFSQSIGRLYKSHCVQMLWESTEEHIVGDCRKLKVGQETDLDSSLDKIVKPYDGGLVLPKFRF